MTHPSAAAKMIKMTIPWPLSFALVVALAAACTPDPAATVGNRAPSYAAETLDGESVSLASLRGEVVLLNIWATWCFPCRREMPSFQALHRDFSADGLRVVAVSIDSPGAQQEIASFLTEYGIDFSILHDPEQRIARTFGTIGVPETFLIDRDGVLVRHWRGRIDGHSEGIRGPIRDALGGRSLAGR
jgi:cytochrome c biogenesis protein CcmG, thiol:disulfide interchange protein DsbE